MLWIEEGETKDPDVLSQNDFSDGRRPRGMVARVAAEEEWLEVESNSGWRYYVNRRDTEKIRFVRTNK